MNFVKTIGIGIILGFIFGILGIIPFCSCFIGPFLGFLGGFLLVKIINVKQNDYYDLFIHLFVYSISGAIIGMILIYVINMYLDPSYMSVVISPGFSLSNVFDSVIFPFIYVFITLFIFGALGGIIYMFTKK